MFFKKVTLKKAKRVVAELRNLIQEIEKEATAEGLKNPDLEELLSKTVRVIKQIQNNEVFETCLVGVCTSAQALECARMQRRRR